MLSFDETIGFVGILQYLNLIFKSFILRFLHICPFADIFSSVFFNEI